MWTSRRRRGQAIIETAVIAMFLVILLLGVIGFGTILQASIRVEVACREGARIITTGGTAIDARTEILKNLSRTGNPADAPGKIAIGITPMDDTLRTFNADATVEIWWNFPVPVPLFNLIVRERMLYARVVMPITVGTGTGGGSTSTTGGGTTGGGTTGGGTTGGGTTGGGTTGGGSTGGSGNQGKGKGGG